MSKNSTLPGPPVPSHECGRTMLVISLMSCSCLELLPVATFADGASGLVWSVPGPDDWTPGVSPGVVPGSGLHGDAHYADQLLFPDPDSLRAIPWLPATASVVCLGYWSPDQPQRAAPRWVFSQLVAASSRRGVYLTPGQASNRLRR